MSFHPWSSRSDKAEPSSLGVLSISTPAALIAPLAPCLSRTRAVAIIFTTKASPGLSPESLADPFTPFPYIPPPHALKISFDPQPPPSPALSSCASFHSRRNDSLKSTRLGLEKRTPSPPSLSFSHTLPSNLSSFLSTFQYSALQYQVASKDKTTDQDKTTLTILTIHSDYPSSSLPLVSSKILTPAPPHIV
jgi:hypothetical protein